MSVMLYYRVFTGVCHSVHGGCTADIPLNKHPFGQTPSQTDTPPGRHPPLGKHPSRQTPLRQTHPYSDIPLRQLLQRTGMHSYWNAFLFFFFFFFLFFADREESSNLSQFAHIYFYLSLLSLLHLHWRIQGDIRGACPPPPV